MRNIKEINIKNRTYYFFNDMINIKSVDSSLLKINKKSYKNIDNHYFGYIKMKSISDYKSINSVNPLYLIIGEASNGDKCLVFASTDKIKDVLTKYTKLWDEIKYLIKTINGGEGGEYGKNFMKIRFETDDNLPLGRILKLFMLTV